MRYSVDFTTKFKKQHKKLKKQGKDLTKLYEVIELLANKEELEPRYRNHNLVNDKYYKECSECHIEPDWLLVYQYHDDELLLLLMNTGSHSEVFGK